MERYEVDRDYAWETALYRSTGGWSVMETARIAAKKLRAAHPDLFRDLATPAPGPLPVIPHHDRVERPYGDDLSSGPGMAAATRRGQGNRTNQDAATLVTLPNGDRVAAAVNGVFSYPGSRLAANRFAAAIHTELTRTDRGVRTPTQAMHDAHRAGLAALAGHFTPETGHSAVTYVAAYHATDGTITIFHVGTARAYLLPLDTSVAGHGATEDQRRLTTDDSRGGLITDAGVMTRWAGSDHRPEPTVTRLPASVAGLLVLATDGLWRYLPNGHDLEGALGAGAYANPEPAASDLADTAHTAGGRDDLTVAVMQVLPPGDSAGPATTSLGGGGAVAEERARQAG
ncbi:PP2C family protein-serine/threonine phosphatase [Pseudonocardia sichuanensis]